MQAEKYGSDFEMSITLKHDQPIS